MIKEFREFFERTIKVISGYKADQELNFPVEHTVNTCNGAEKKYNRLLSEHYASDDVIKKFLESITFKLNSEDTSKVDEQGLVTKATDAQAATNYVDVSAFTKGLQSHQTPILIDTSNNILAVKYQDLITSTFYTDINDAIATGHPFTKAYVVVASGGSTSEKFKIVFGTVHYPLLRLHGTDVIADEVIYDMTTVLKQTGDLVNYKTCMQFQGDENNTISYTLCAHDGSSEMVLYTIFSGATTPVNAGIDFDVCAIRGILGGAPGIYISTTPISTDVNFLGQSFAKQTNFLALPATFKIYGKVTTTGTDPSVLIGATYAETKIQ